MSLEEQKNQVLELTELALEKARALNCDASINVSVGKEYATRFSNSEILQNYVDLRRIMEITVVYNDKQRAASTTNTFTKENIINLVEFLAKVAKTVSPDPAYPGIVKEKQNYSSLKLNDPKASRIDPDYIADRIDATINAGESIDKRIGGVSGNLLFSDGFEYHKSTAGNELFYPSTVIESTININALSGGEESRSNSIFGNRFFDKLPLEKEAEEVAERALRGLNAQSIEPGNYEVILDHQAVSTILFFVGYATSSRLIINRASFLNDRIGQQVFDEDLSLINDPHNPEHLSARPIDDEGLPTTKFPVIEEGILKNYSYSRLDAARLGAKAQGTGFSFMGNAIGFPFAETIQPGDMKVEEMIADIKNGLLVTNLHYTNFVNPPVGSITGMSKDGLFIIKNGEIIGSAKNMRFTDTIPNILKDIDVGKELKQPGGRFANIVAPIRTKNFRFTSKTSH